ncbi:MAG: sugar ABC transporter ATP-binding protein [Bacillota bacterium]|jgi:ribose transport system ATP-binding protein|nr:sugar ABC transporter ATP-binding protein [Bacillota bacterium]HHT90945.1 sugar ABC transporter ATP-binding protein [Bacillota bacterium]
MNRITKSFGANVVLKDVSITIKGGEICALIGENGAGKSTLMNILGGVHPMDSGEILISGRKVKFTTPAQSLGAGIAFIHQELNLINDLPIFENMFIGRERKDKWGRLDRTRMYQETEDIFRRMNIDLDPNTMVRDLDASYKQIVEICRAIMMDASVIIMDEPTTSLTEPEIERVFQMMRTLKEQGVGIVFISHKLGEVMEICQRYLVLRDGELVAEGRVEDVTTDDLARCMVGHALEIRASARTRNLGREVLRLEDFTHAQDFRNISLSVREGEILGVTGLLGDGRSALFQTVFGADKSISGRMFLHGAPLRIHSTEQALKLGIGYLPRNRKENGIIKDMNVLENASIVAWPLFAKRGVIDQDRHLELFCCQRKELDITMQDVSDAINTLSGGNQQKVVLAKWLAANPKLLILDNPTQGVDVGAKEEIYAIILKLSEKGMAIVVLSSEAQEIIRLCDRALVMYHGEIQGEVAGAAMTEHDIMRLATGGVLDAV